ncbi:MAG: hypothetical protein O7H39_02415 [Gammaproteobacteria bacterium]|nr:hypothetical protein [Gammaproteobacteria bacterium]
MNASSHVPRFAWMSALSVSVLYLAVLLGVSVARDALALRLAGSFTLGEALLLVMHVLPVVLGFEYLRRTPRTDLPDEEQDRS